MFRPRVIPCLLLKNLGLVKTVKFRDPIYLGDPINIVKIFNDKEVDELLFLDTTASIEQKKPPFELIARIADECFMPLGYGGGIRNITDIKKILTLGVEKVSINSYALENPCFIRQAADLFGSQSIVVSIDVKKDWLGRYRVFTYGGKKDTGLEPTRVADQMEGVGAGELIITSIDRDGTMQGYDVNLIKSVADAVSIPVVACGGARNISDLYTGVKQGGVSAVAAGSMFVFQGRHRAVLISYPSADELEKVFT
jgi:cyclase